MVAMQDSGAGLHPRDTERVSEPFYSTKPGGLGLGLSISRTIVESYGGKYGQGRIVPVHSSSEGSERFEGRLAPAQGLRHDRPPMRAARRHR